MKRLILVFGLLPWFLLTAQTLRACSFVTIGGPPAICERYQGTKIVFVGVVTDADQPLGTSTRRVRLQVTEAFRGITEEQVEFTTGMSSCDIYFKRGVSYLVYADWNEQTGELKTDVTLGTTGVEYAQDALRYIRALKEGELQSRIFGVVTAEPNDVKNRYGATKPLAGIRVTATSETGKWQAVSGPKGDYELNVPAGNYALSAELAGVPATQVNRMVEIDQESCSRQNFLSTPVGSISGRVVDLEGSPVANVLVEIQAVPPTPQPRLDILPFTRSDGKFQYKNLPQGEYLIGIKFTSPPRLRNYRGMREVPYPTTYYPGVTERAFARVFKIEGSNNIDNLELKLSAPLAERTIIGKVEWPDGAPAQASVDLMDLDFRNDSCRVARGHTSAQGEFAVMGLESRPYLVSAIAKKGRDYFQSEFVEVQQGANVPIHLKLSPRDIRDVDLGCRTVKNWQR